MMKRAGNIIVIFLLLTATGGLSVTRHYCGQSMVSFSLFSTPEQCCGRECDKCHNEFSFNKVTDDFTVSSSDDVKPQVTINPVQAGFIIDLFRTLPAAPFAATITPRKFLFRKTGDFPVSYSNFRC
jgi:hypothetical protein